MVLTSPILVSAQLPTSSLPDRHSTIQKRTPIPPTVSFVAGGVAGGVEAAATYPFEFAKTRVQLANKGPVPTNPLSVIAHVVRNDGIRAVYTGCSTLILVENFFRLALMLANRPRVQLSKPASDSCHMTQSRIYLLTAKVIYRR